MKTVGDSSPKPRIVSDMYRSSEVKGEGAMSKIHSTPKKGGGKKNQIGPSRIISGK